MQDIGRHPCGLGLVRFWFGVPHVNPTNQPTDQQGTDKPYREWAAKQRKAHQKERELRATESKGGKEKSK